MPPNIFINPVASPEEFIPVFLQRRIVDDFDQAQPITGLVSFLAANSDSHQEILLADRFIRFYVIRANGSGRPNDLF